MGDRRGTLAEGGGRQPAVGQEAEVHRHSGGMGRQRLDPAEGAPGAEIVPAPTVGALGGGGLGGVDVAAGAGDLRRERRTERSGLLEDDEGVHGSGWVLGWAVRRRDSDDQKYS